MEEGPAIEEPPPPPPLQTGLIRELESGAHAGLQDLIPQEFQKIIVHGKNKSPGRRRRAPFQPSDQHLPTGRLKLFCFDKTTGKPLGNVQVHLKVAPGNDTDKTIAKTVSNAFGNRALSRRDGYVVCKVLANYSYRISATASGYHDFGYMGESLTLNPKESEVLQGEVAMIPVRISVVVTLRELRPIHQHDSLQRDTAGQVHPLTSIPRTEMRSAVPPPQKVSFYSSEGIKMDFVATTIERQDVLVGWPSAMGATAETAACTLGVYSTDSTGHCYFYGPKLVGGRRGNNAGGRKVGGGGPREWTTIDVGRWECARKYHLRSNNESPVCIFFDNFTKQVDYPSHIARYPPRGTARSPSPTRERLTPPPGRSKEQIMDSFLVSAAAVATAASNGGRVADPNEPTPPTASAADPADGSGNGNAPASPVRTSSSRTIGGGGAAASANRATSRPASALSLQQKSASRNALPLPSGGEGSGGGGPAEAEAEVAEVTLDAGNREEVEAEMRAYSDNNIHSYIDPGSYKLQMKDPSKLLIFYTYSGDGEAAEINQAQNAVVPINMHAADESFIHPRDGTVMRSTKYPVQLYCRARPWFQVAVYDMSTLEEIGASHGLSFTIERLTTNVVTRPSDSRQQGFNSSEPLARTRRRRNNQLLDADDDGHPLEEPSDYEPGGNNDDSGIYPYKLEEVVESAQVVYSGILGEMKERMWVTPGEKYRVSVHLKSPFMEYNAVQVRTCNWELEPFVFYAVKKVVLLVEVREIYNQLPIPNTEVVVEVQEPPQTPRPPVMKPEWCEDAKAYALRVMDQLIDYVVQSNRERAAADEGPITTYRAYTDAEGLVTFELPPEARVYVRAVNSADFEDTNASREVQLTNMAEQFVSIQLERVTRTAAVVLDANMNEGVAGFELRAYDVTHYTDMPRDGTRKSRHLLDMDHLDAIDTSNMEPFAVEMTGPEGAINAPFCRRAGRVIKVEVVRTPRTHHMPSMVMNRGTNSMYTVTYDRQSLVFKAPPRPKVKVSCHDTCTFEEVQGVRFRIMVRPFGPPPADHAGANATSVRGGARSLRASASRSSRSHPASISPSIHPPPSAPASVSIGVGGDLLPDVEELAGAQELTAGGDPGSPTFTAITTPGRENLRLLQDQHRGTLQQIEELESKLLTVNGPDGAEDGGEESGPQRGQLEGLLGQLKAMMQLQQERLDAMMETQDHKPHHSAAVEADDASSVLEHATVGTGGVIGADPLRSLATRSSRGMASSPGMSAGQDAGGNSIGGAATTSMRIREADSGPASGGAQGGALGVFSGGVRRMLSRVAGGGGGLAVDDDDDEEEAIRKLRAAEEEMMAVFNPAPEEQDPWGRVVWDSVTGHEENEDLIFDADCEVAVQIFPAWPYDPRSQILKGRCVGHVGPPEFRFFLPRDGNAFRFWLDRDNALPGFWDEESAPVLPYHSLARLQPNSPASCLLARAHPDMKLLRPAAYDANKTGDGTYADADGAIAGKMYGGGGTSIYTSGPKHDWKPRLQLNFNYTAAMAALGGGGPAAAAAARSRLYFNNGAESVSFLGATAGGGVPDGGMYECESMLPDGSRVLHRTMSAVQFDPNDSSDNINDLAWQQLRLCDASYLPLERTRVLQFLTRWGSFPHVAGGHCKACSGVERPPDTNPLLLAESPPTPRPHGEVPQVGFGVGFSMASGYSRSGAPTGTGAGSVDGAPGGSVDGAPGAVLTRGSGGLLYKSRLMSRRELAAKWVFDGRPPPRLEGPAVKRYVPDRFARTHTIMGSSEAVYCKSPFFTWWLPNGGGVHVTISDGLYRDLIPFIDSVAVSLEYMEQHLEKVRMLNEGRCQDGRFLLGHQVVDSFSGGVFIMDVSTAQPFSGVSFILEQLSKMFDYWASETPMGAPRPRFNVLLCSREVIECWRSALGTVTHNLGKRLLPWYEDIKYKMPTAPGFNMVKALRTAGAMAKSEVPIFLLCGGLVESPLNSNSEMSKVLYEMQLACLNSQAPMQPVVAVELFPMPQARLESFARVQTSQSGEEEVTEKRSVPVRMGGHFDDASEISVEEAATLGSNIFALLVESLSSTRIRLLEVFREVDKDGDHALDWQQLYRLVLRLVPDATPAHVRYVQLLLDCTGDNLVRYKDLAAAMRACGRGGISVSLRDKLEVQLVLHKMAIVMLLSKITPIEMFAKYDNDQDGFWSERELSAMLKDLFPGLRPAEHQLLFEAWKDVDKNQDGRISLDEFTRAFSSGGVPGLPGSSILSHPDQIQRMKEAGELDDFTIMAMKATEENKRLDRVRATGFPLSETLVRVAGATRGQHRRLDLGRARAFADRIDLRPLEAVRDSLQTNLQQLLAFEEAYGKQLTYDYQLGRALRSSRALGGSLTADPPSPSASTARLTRPTNSARARVGSASTNSPFAATLGTTAAATHAGSPNQSGGRSSSPTSSPVRARSAARSRPISRPRSAASGVMSASFSNPGGVGSSRPASAAAGSGSMSARGLRPGSASKTRPAPTPAWVAVASASEDPHLRRLASASREASEPEGSAGSNGTSSRHLAREGSAAGSHPWSQGGHGGGPVISREVSNRSSLLAGMVGGEASGGGGGGDDSRLIEREEYRPPSERSSQRPRASYGSRRPSQEPSGGSVGVGDGGVAAAEGSGGSGGKTSRPSSAPARRRGANASDNSALSVSSTMPPLAFSRLPASAARKSLPLKTAMLGFDADDADALPNIPDPNVMPGSGFSGGGAGGRPQSATRRSVAARSDAQSSRGGAWS